MQAERCGPAGGHWRVTIFLLTPCVHPAVQSLRVVPLSCRYKWDTLPAEQRPERGLLALRAGLNAFANLRPAVVLPQLADASSLKRAPVLSMPAASCWPPVQLPLQLPHLCMACMLLTGAAAGCRGNRGRHRHHDCAGAGGRHLFWRAPGEPLPAILEAALGLPQHAGLPLMGAVLPAGLQAEREG